MHLITMLVYSARCGDYWDGWRRLGRDTSSRHHGREGPRPGGRSAAEVPQSRRDLLLPTLRTLGPSTTSTHQDESEMAACVVGRVCGNECHGAAGHFFEMFVGV